MATNWGEIGGTLSNQIDLNNTLSNLQTQITAITNDYVKKSEVVDNLTSTYTEQPLSANQGKVLKDTKQDNLNDAQMNSVNSGITSLKRQQYDTYENGKQDTLTATQLEVVNSGITAATIANINTNISTLTTNITNLTEMLTKLTDRVTRLEKILIDGETV